MRAKFLLTVFFFTLFAAHSAKAQLSPNNRLLFVADMTGQQETPAVVTNARGLVTFLLSEDRTTLRVYGVFSGLSGPIMACHIHTGVGGVAGPVFVPFTNNIQGNRIHAEIPVPDAFLTKGLANQLYFNVHTAANPGGEIRGQLELMNDVMYATVMTGLNETPPVSSAATGLFKLTYSPGDFKAYYTASINGLSGPMTAAHIHVGAAGVAGPVVAPLSPGLPNTLAGELDFTSLPANFMQKLDSNLLYVNAHTAANPGGEIRGQLVKLGPLAFQAFLNGDQETPPVTTAANGVAVASLSTNLDSITYYVNVSGLSGPATAAHFHFAPAGTAGPVIIPLTATAAPNFYTAKVAITSTQLTNLLNGNIYVNVHTAANPGGEIRGQMEPILRRVFAFDLCSEQETPPNGSAAQGVAYITTNNANTHLNYRYLVDGLSGPPTAAHVHKGAFGVSGPVYLPVNTPTPLGSGQFQITGDDVVNLESGDTYLNVHTAANPGGEVRGQVGRELRCSANVATIEPVLEAQSVSPNPSTGPLDLRLRVSKAFQGRLILSDPSGRIMYSEALSFPEGDQLVSLDLGTLPAGLYIGHIASGQYGTVYAFKVVKE